MMTDSLKTDRSLDQLGLPPMELAESNERSTRCIYRCMYPTMQKVLILLILITFSAGIYVLLLKLLESTSSSYDTKIILMTGKETHNITVHQNDWDIFFQLKNRTGARMKRRKRNVLNPNDRSFEIMNRYRVDNFKKIKEIILNHHPLCNDEKQKEMCDKLILELKIIAQNEKTVYDKDVIGVKDLKRSNSVYGLTDVSKREAHSPSVLRNVMAPVPEPLSNHPTHIQANKHPQGGPHLTETCLLAKLLKHSYPQVQEIYDPSSVVAPQIEQSYLTNMRYFLPSVTSKIQNRESDTYKQMFHPQDIGILNSFFHMAESSPKKTPKSSGTLRCPLKTLSCTNNEDCIEENQWCDGKVDCSDASDEIACSCKSRVDPSRLCDGYFDCPFGEDEMGCFDCSENAFSCIMNNKLDVNTQRTCFTKEQRCDGIKNCPNHKDEMECNMLAPTLHTKSLFAISNTEGYLHRNFKGDWYAVCRNPYMWAHDACSRETGLIIRPPIIRFVTIDPVLKVNYLDTEPGGFMTTSDTCFNSSAVYVMCPELFCGTTVQVTSQFLRENMASEDHLFGRNRRSLYPGRPLNPYYMIYYRNPIRRDLMHINAKDTVHEKETPVKSNDERNRRSESRVVGGRPSQPAAWPWMVAIYRNGMFHCGGVVINKHWIISAAHCVHKFWEFYYEVQVGMLRRFSFSPQEQNHRVSHVIVNHKYSKDDMKDDVSLLRVEPAIQFSRWVRPICLPGPNTAGPDWLQGPMPGTTCTAVGWGATEEKGPDPDHLREVEVPVWAQCKHRDDRAGNEICAGLVEGGKDACQGDSGGPLLCRNPLNSQQWYMAGIVSHGDGCGRKNEPGVYTRVSSFVKWIKSHTSSKLLPYVRPIQECPGFKCQSDTSKCLPNKKKCDKIVDCLDAEDEINCEYLRASGSLMSNSTENIIRNKKSDKNSRTVKSAFTETTPKDEIVTKMIDPSDIRFSTTENLINTNDKFTDTTNINFDDIQSNEVIPSTTLSTFPDFAHASTVEISPTQSFELFDAADSKNESVETLVTNKEINETTTEDSQIYSITFKPKVLESRSSVLDASEKKDLAEKNENSLASTSYSRSNEERIINITEKSRGDDIFEEEVSTEENFLDIFFTKSNNNSQSINFENATENAVIEVLSRFNLSNNDLKNTSNQLNDSKISENKVESISAKNLPGAESKSNVINKIDKIAFTELQPASIRRKQRVPKDFECRRINQLIPFNRRCDHRADCEDGTDELGCVCIDYLSAFDDKLICDGIFDCADGQDENDCYTCPDDHFLCKRSEICLPSKYVCDGQAQCVSGEDELNCFALSNGRDMLYEVDEKPRINLEGYLTKRNKNDWEVVCEDKLSIEQQEESATQICRYLGFSSAKRFFVKYINVKEEDILRSRKNEYSRMRRGTGAEIPVHFAFRDDNMDNGTARNIVIKEPQVLKEECVPNITKTCKSLYVFCDESLYTNFEISQDLVYSRAADTQNKHVTSHMWPWIAKVYVEGVYKCTGILIDVSWVLVSDSCLWDSLPNQNFISVILGSHRTLHSTNGFYEQVHNVDAKKDLYRSRVVLLHLRNQAEYSNYVKPMIVSFGQYHDDRKTICIAIGQDNSNNTITIFLNETTKNCNLSSKCYERQDEKTICSDGMESHRPWSGLVSCHNELGWYPAASFVDSRGECGLTKHIIATAIEHLKHDLKDFSDEIRKLNTLQLTESDICKGIRCGRGKCVSLGQMCDGVKNCEDGNDETEDVCRNKQQTCKYDPYQNGCGCLIGQMKCKNGKCISKELFNDGNDDCGDQTDEPKKTICFDYLLSVMPSRLCDGMVHCHDRSDENPAFCKCFAKDVFTCDKSDRVKHCVAPDMVCDGIRDCPNGDDERHCMALTAPKGTLLGTGQVIVRSHGVWHSKCYPTQNHTKSHLEAICKELGFISGHAKEIKDKKYHVNTHNKLILEPFSEVVLNNQTVLRMRNTDEPVARSIFDPDLMNCFPVFIECI